MLLLSILMVFGFGLLARVLVDLPVLHDQREAILGFGQDRNVLERIAGHQQEVGLSAFLDHAELSGIRVAGPDMASNSALLEVA